MPIEELRGELLTDIKIVLFGQPDRAYLALFLRDPENQRTYHFRKMHLVEGALADGEVLKASGRAIPYLDIEKIEIEGFSDRRFSIAELPMALRDVKRGEEMAGRDPDPVVSRTQAVVGIAEYTGGERVDVEGLARLAALKYHFLMLARQRGAAQA